MDENYLDIINYVDAASLLAEQLMIDLTRGPTISTETIVNLSKFHSAAQRVSMFLEMIEKDKKTIN